MTDQPKREPIPFGSLTREHIYAAVSMALAPRTPDGRKARTRKQQTNALVQLVWVLWARLQEAEEIIAEHSKADGSVELIEESELVEASNG